MINKSTKQELQYYYGELIYVLEHSSDFVEIKRIKEKMKAIEVLLDMDILA